MMPPPRRTDGIRDVCAEVTARIVRELERGVAPWVQPWQALGGLPRNAATGRAYSGTNLLCLAFEQARREYDRPLWLTFRQARQLGGHVRRGEKGTHVVLMRPTVYARVDERTGEEEVREGRVLRSFTVFNVAQCTLPDVPAFAPVADLPEIERHAQADALIAGRGARVQHGAPMPFYDRRADVVHLPESRAFEDAGAYYCTALHELTHWTGHEERLNRDQAGRFGSAVRVRGARRRTRLGIPLRAPRNRRAPPARRVHRPLA